MVPSGAAAGRLKRDDHVNALEAQHLAALGIVAAGHPPLGQGRVQVDHMRHDRGPDDAGHQQQDVVSGRARPGQAVAGQAGPGQAGHQAGRDARPAHAHRGQVIGEAEQDQPQQGGDGQLEPPVAALVQGQDAEGDHGRDEPGGQQRHAEQQVEPDRGADELGQVGRHRDQLGLDPQPARHRAGQMVTAQLRQVPAGGHAELGRQVLDQHRHQVGHHDHPGQAVAELRPGGDVSGEVAGVDVGHRRDERRPEHGSEAPVAAARAHDPQRVLRRGRGGPAG
jgi:hypothetical protein